MVLTLDKNFLKNNLIIFALFACSALTGIVPQMLLSVLIVILCGMLMLRDELYLAYPFVIFYNNLYGIVFGFSVQRIFTLMVIILLFFKLLQNKTLMLKRDIFLPILVYILYSILVVTQYSLISAFFTMLDVVSCALLITYYFVNKEENLKRFFSVYVLVCLSALWTGIVTDNMMAYSFMERFLATFEDPNYMSFFYTVAIFSVISLELFRPWIRRIVIIILYAVILMSLSMTAVVVNVMLWGIYLLLTKKINIKTVLIGFAMVLLLLWLYDYGTINPDTPYIGDICRRINDTIGDFLLGDMSGVTTGRTVMIQEHLEYYFGLSPIQTLLGGIPVNTSYIFKEFEHVAHNEYIDMLLNVGLLGTIVLLGFFIKRLLIYFKKYRSAGDRNSLCLVMYKVTWAIYVLSLTVFIDDRFMLPFFI